MADPVDLRKRGVELEHESHDGMHVLCDDIIKRVVPKFFILHGHVDMLVRQSTRPHVCLVAILSFSLQLESQRIVFLNEIIHRCVQQAMLKQQGRAAVLIVWVLNVEYRQYLPVFSCDFIDSKIHFK